MAHFFQAAVDRELRGKLESQRTVDDVMGVIRSLLGGEIPEELELRHEVPELTFSYEEEASPEDFFVPYVWSVVVETSPALIVARDRIQIFTLETNAGEAPDAPPRLNSLAPSVGAAAAV